MEWKDREGGRPEEPLPRRVHVAQGDFVYREPEPPVYVEARGAVLIDAEGRRYLDAEAANGAVAFGYDPSILLTAAARGASMPGLPSFCESALRLRVAERLSERLERETGVVGRVAFELGGAQGIELALKISRMNKRGSIFATFEGGYHGRSALTSHLSASQRYRAILGGDCRVQVLRLPYPDCAQCRFGRDPRSCHVECASFVKVLLDDDLCGVATPGGAEDVCAFIFEPVLNVGGMVSPDPRYLEGVVRLFRERGALIIVDEIFTGFYRTGKPWGFMHYDVVPDIVVASKALTNGLCPMSFVWARDPLAAPERFPPGTHSVTFANNPLSMSVAETVLDRLDAWSRVEADVHDLEQALRSTLDVVTQRTRLVKGASVLGATGRLVLQGPIAPVLRRVAATIARDAPVDGIHGLLVASTGMAPNVLCIHPPLVTTREEVGIIGELLSRAFAAVEGAAEGKA